MDVFPFVVSQPYKENFDHRDVAIGSRAETGKQFRRVKVPFSRYTLRADVILPQPALARDLSELREFYDAHVVTAFLISPKEFKNRHVVETFSGWDGSTPLELAYRHIDEDSVTGTVDGSPTTVVLAANGTRPTAAPAAGAGLAVIEYDILVPVFFDEPVLDHEGIVPGNSEDSPGSSRFTIAVGETDNGQRYSEAVTDA